MPTNPAARKTENNLKCSTSRLVSNKVSLVNANSHLMVQLFQFQDIYFIRATCGGKGSQYIPIYEQGHFKRKQSLQFNSTFCTQRGLTHFQKPLEGGVILLVLGYLRHYSNLEKFPLVSVSIVFPIFIFSAFRAFNYYSKNVVNELFWSSDAGDIGK